MESFRDMSSITIKGDLHGHSVYSDGKITIEEAVCHAISLRYQYIAFTDHSQSLTVAGGLTVEKVYSRLEEIVRLREKYPQIKILNGTEVDILPDGTLDYPDAILNEFDLVIASIHIIDQSSYRNITKRLLAACASPYVDIIGHPTCRMKKVDYISLIGTDKVFDVAADTGTVLEINANGINTDLDVENIVKAKGCGVRFALNTDFHKLEHFSFIARGLQAVIAAGLNNTDIINTMDYNDLMLWLKN